MPKVSIIVPVYKVEKYLHECIESILIQTYKDWELLLIDDGSPDRSGEICDEYARRDARISVIHKSNEGVSSARNIGLEQVRGEWVMFVDADDAIAPNSLDQCLRKCTDNQLDVIQFSYSRNRDFSDGNVAETKPLSPQEYFEERKFLVCVGGTLIRSSIINANHIRFDCSLKLAEDQLVMMDCMRNAQRLQRIPDCLYYYRDNQEGASRNLQYDALLTSVDALFKYAKEHPMCKEHCIYMVYVFLDKILRNKECNKQSVFCIQKQLKNEKYMGDIKLVKLFSVLSRFSSSLAYYASQVIAKISYRYA